MKSFASIYQLKAYLKYFLQADSNNYIHSDFVYKWYEAVHKNNDVNMDSFARDLAGFFSNSSIKYIIRTKEYLNGIDSVILNDEIFLGIVENKSSEYSEISPCDFLVIPSTMIRKLKSKLLPLISSRLTESSSIIVGGIRDSKLSFASWNSLRQNERFNITIDFGDLGFLFQINNRSPKQHFILK